MSKKFTILVFTASSQDYADKILDGIDPERKYIDDRLYREHCFEYDGKKNLKKNFFKIFYRHFS